MKVLQFKRALPGALFIFALLLFGCQRSSDLPFHFTRFAMDTVIDYTIAAPDRQTARDAMLNAQREIERIDGLLWEKNQGSEIYRFNHSSKGIETTGEVFEFVRRAVDYYWEEVRVDIDRTTGVFDITIGSVLNLYDFQSENANPPGKAAIDSALRYVGIKNIQLRADPSGNSYYIGKTDPGVTLAVGGIAKGYAVDNAIDTLRTHGFTQVLINAGGDLYCQGTKMGKPWKVGVQHPVNLNEILKVLELADNAIATSGNYQRYYMHNEIRYHHLINPLTGKPSRNSRSASVIAPSTEEADVWATILFIAGPKEGIRLINSIPKYHGMVVDSVGHIHYSNDFETFLAK